MSFWQLNQFRVIYTGPKAWAFDIRARLFDEAVSDVEFPCGVQVRCHVVQVGVPDVPWVRALVVSVDLLGIAVAEEATHHILIQGSWYNKHKLCYFTIKYIKITECE